MSLAPGLHLRATQSLVLTPQLQQAIKLLQLSRMELCDMVRDEMLENPILEDSVESANEQEKAADAPATADGNGAVANVLAFAEALSAGTVGLAGAGRR